MGMEQKIVEQELRRQRQEQRRKKRRRRIMQRNMILFIGFIVVIFIIKGTISALSHSRSTSQKVSTVSNNTQEQDKKQKKLAENQDSQVIQKFQEELREGNLILVNDQTPITEYSDAHLVEIGSYLEGVCNMKSKDIKLKEEAVLALKEMIQAFDEAVGDNDLAVVSGYRDFNTQEALHYNSLQEESKGDTFVARPDRSEHHTGLAIDFSICYKDGTSSNYDGTGVYKWINENCHNYGFIMRYDSSKKDKTGIGYEPWHFRYVGKQHASIMKELNLCLEEYIELLRGYTYYVNPGQGITKATQNYSIYYVPSEGNMTQIPVPMNKPYEISGNNKDGYIVTVALISESGK